MDKVSPVVVIRTITENYHNEYKIEKIVTIDRFFQITSYCTPCDTFESLKEIGEYVFNKIQTCDEYTMCHITPDYVKYDILIIDIADADNIYTYVPECHK